VAKGRLVILHGIDRIYHERQFETSARNHLKPAERPTVGFVVGRYAVPHL